MSKRTPSLQGLEPKDAIRELQRMLQAVEGQLADALQRLEAHGHELAQLRQQLDGRGGSPSFAAAAEAAPPAAAERLPISPALGNVLKLVHAGKAEEAKAALAAIPAEERNAQPAVLAITAAALCIAREDYPNALNALNKARQLTDDARLLRIVELVGQKLPAAQAQ